MSTSMEIDYFGHLIEDNTQSLIIISDLSHISGRLLHARAYLRGGGFRGFKPPPEIFRFFLKSEGKEIERKRKKGMLEGGGGVTS